MAQQRLLMKGTEAIAEAAIRAGCVAFFGYPITPQNEIPEYMSRRMPQVGPADRRALAAGMPPALAGLADLPPAGRALAAAQRARAARDRSRDYRARATDAAGEVRELRQRVVELLRRIAQVRLAIARQAASLRTSSQLETVDLLPAAKARRVRLTGVRLVGQVRERDLARETRILQAEGPLDAVGAWVGDLADRPGVATEGLE